MTGNKVLITGANGFLGGRVVEDFVDKGFEVTATGRQDEFTNKLLNCKYIKADLESEVQVNRMMEYFDCIIHCAAKSSPWGSYEEFYKANYLATSYILQAAKFWKVPKIIFISTPSVYFTFGDRWNIKESDPLPHPMVNHYASTKYIAEQLLLESSIPTIALRPRAMIGRGDTVIMPRLLKAYTEGRLRIIGDGKNIVDLTPVSNVVHSIHDAINAKEEAWNQAYNITAGQPLSLWDTIERLFEKLNLDFPKKKIPFGIAFYFAWANEFYGRWVSNKEPALTRYSVGILKYSMTMDISKAKELLNFVPQQSVESGMDEFVNWWNNPTK